jgi:predicted metalloprotease
MKWKLALLQRHLSVVWQQFFALDAPRIYSGPKIVGYTGSRTSGCGPLGPGNAFYCEGDNTIYYDENFFVAEMKNVGTALHTDGDFAPAVILAHEWGHAADYWYRRGQRLPAGQTFATEQLADCLAGATTRSAQRDKRLDRGDLEEAERELQAGGDTFDPRAPNRPKSHGTAGERLKAFRKGYNGEAPVCLADRRAFK